MDRRQSICDPQTVEQLIPQKFPFVMVDKLFSYSETALESGLTITGSNIFTCNGSFREPGVVEHMAQSVALHTGYKFFLREEPAPTGYIGSINNLEILALPELGDQIQTSVNILQEFGDITMVSISSRCNDVEIARCQMKTVLAS